MGCNPTLLPRLDFELVSGFRASNFGFGLRPCLPGYGVNTPWFGRRSRRKVALMANGSLVMQTSGACDSREAAKAQSTLSIWELIRLRVVGGLNPPMKPWVARVLPDPEICRAKAAGFDGYSDCLVDRPCECRHSLSFGNGFFCLHPQRHEIVMRTSALGLGQTGFGGRPSIFAAVTTPPNP
jgi:hypothetical protein